MVSVSLYLHYSLWNRQKKSDSFNGVCFNDLLLTGTEAWVYRLKIADQFSKAEKKPMEIDGIPQAFAKTVENFQYYYILAAGHMVINYLYQPTVGSS